MRSEKGAFWVGLGILLSRLMGLVRERVFAHFFGNSNAAAAFRVAMRIPNFLQNLFGEGVLSASFIPVYAKLLGEKKDEEARWLANATLGILSLSVAVMVILGMSLTPLIVKLIAPGFTGETQELTIKIVRLIFPGIGILVLSAWCLGILNSHRKFFLSYSAPVFWNLAIIASISIFGFSLEQTDLTITTAWGVVVGCVLQFSVQLPSVMKLVGALRPRLSLARASIRQVVKNFGPVVLSRGVVQVSAYIDVVYASLVSERAVAALSYAQTIYLIPVSLFGMAVSVAALPEMSQVSGNTSERHAHIVSRIDAGMSRIAFFVIPSAVAFLFLGDVVSALLLQTGRFFSEDSRYVWYLLMGSTCGLLATTLGRLYSSAFYALQDTKTPLYFATIRVLLTAVLAYICVVELPFYLPISKDLSVVGITATTGLVAWFEFLMLRKVLNSRIGKTGMGFNRLARLWGAALFASCLALVVKNILAYQFGSDMTSEWMGHILPMPRVHPVLTAFLVLGSYGLSYIGLTLMQKIPESLGMMRRLKRK